MAALSAKWCAWLMTLSCWLKLAPMCRCVCCAKAYQIFAARLSLRRPQRPKPNVPLSTLENLADSWHGISWHTVCGTQRFRTFRNSRLGAEAGPETHDLGSGFTRWCQHPDGS